MIARPGGTGRPLQGNSVMTALLDVDQLRTFIAIAETGSFTRAADIVHKTQSAVSMQMKRLEERLDRAIFARDGRASNLNEDGERLLDYARRIVKLNLAIITNCAGSMTAENFRQERLLWATSNRHSIHCEERVPLALGRPTCAWRRAAIECLDALGRPYRV